MLMVTIEVTSRYVFNHPIPGYIDYMEWMMVALVFLCLAYCQREGGHIRMELFMTRVLRGGRRYHAAEALHAFVCLAGFTIITIGLIANTFHAYAINDVGGTIYFPTWPARMLVAIGSVFICIRFILQIVQHGWLVGVKGRNLSNIK